MLGEAVVIVRAAVVVNRYGDTELDWEDVTEFTVPHCGIGPTGGSEDNNGRSAVVSNDTVYASADVATGYYGWSQLGEPLAAVWPQDKVRIRGELHDVVGRIRDWRNPFTSDAGVEFEVVRVDG